MADGLIGGEDQIGQTSETVIASTEGQRAPVAERNRPEVTAASVRQSNPRDQWP